MLPEFRLGVRLTLALVKGAVVWIAARGGSGRLVLAAIAVGSLAASADFNPLVRGAPHTSRRTRATGSFSRSTRSAAESNWIVFGSLYLSNLPRVVGVRAVNRLHPAPQLALGVTHALLHGGDPARLSRFRSYQHLVTVGDNRFFAIHWEDGAEGALP
jgi:hypothetical protein